MPPAARASAAEDPAGPPPMTAARSLRPIRGALSDLEEQVIRREGGREDGVCVVVGLREREEKPWRQRAAIEGS